MHRLHAPPILLPSTRLYGGHHFAIGGLVQGLAVMAVSLPLFV